MRRISLLAGVIALCTAMSGSPSLASLVEETKESLRFGACPQDLAGAYPHLDCATLQVPLDHSRPFGEQVSVTVSRAKATNPAKRRGVLFLNPGGPGQGAADYAGRLTLPSSTGQTRIPAPVLEMYDVIGMDPRGVAHSTPISCGDPAIWSSPLPDPDAVSERQNWWKLLGAFAESCRRNAGDMLPFLNGKTVARDMDRLREALGEDKISYLGYSYGTYLGIAYASAYPHRLDRVILDSAVDPTPVEMAYRGWAVLGQNAAMHKRRDTYFEWVARYDDFFGLGTTKDEVRAAWDTVIAELRRAPRGHGGPAEFIIMTFDHMYTESGWQRLTQAISDFVKRDDDTLLKTLMPNMGGPGTESFLALFNAVSCTDSPWPADRSTWERDAEEHAGRYPGYAVWYNSFYNAACAAWPVPAQQRALPDATKLPPMLIFSSEGDPATPHEGAKALRGLLPSSRLVTEVNAGKHGVFAGPFAQANPAANQLGSDYLVTGALPAQDVSVPGHPFPVPTRQSASEALAEAGAAKLRLGVE
ncbi:alpha/beta hydrolase [Nonomuraea sp. SBT364]|uniref:alpha/beta hydrolase n=1 Tax=Nonomuraea sp. SBT364 TaxID=1580530 RepID=UPI00066AE0F0|nr:alpha/beta hydrolase [Nonomuraea sp. SBT364]